VRGLREGPSIIQHYRGEGFEGGLLYYAERRQSQTADASFPILDLSE